MESALQPILKVDLSKKTIDEINIPSQWEYEYIGGASLSARLLFEKLVQDLDPFSPEAPLLFMNGPLSGTAGPAVGRFVICGRSPATGLWGESNCGGFWGPELRKAGYDGLWIEGCAPNPVYLLITDHQVEIRDGSFLWGLDTYATQSRLHQELENPGFRIASIGIAGETQIPFALILCDHGRVAGRTGMGAVMGSKKLKAIAVKGTGKIPIHNIEKFNRHRSAVNKSLRDDVSTTILRDLGTSATAEYFDYLEEQPKAYFQKGKLGEEIRTTGASMKETILTGVSACHACVIACGRVVTLSDGKARKGPEYETLAGFGPNLMLNDTVFATRMGELCDKYGMDSISTSNIIGLAFHLYNMGVISEKDTGGYPLYWGNQNSIENLVHQIAVRENFGLLLAEGAKAFGRRFGVENEAVQVNGLEVPYHDPRGGSGIAVVYATSPRGACHNQSDYYIVDLGQSEPLLGIEYFDRLAGAEKSANIAKHQDWVTVLNSLVKCIFAIVDPRDTLTLLNGATGRAWELSELIKAGERGWNLKRIINFRLGLRRNNDRIPTAFQRPYSDADKDSDTRIPDFDAMMKAYYQARNWDPISGYPTQEKLESLNLEWVSDNHEK